MRKHIPHPISRLQSIRRSDSELDIVYGGNEKSAIEESLVIARDLRQVVRDGENILHVNTLVSASKIGELMGKRFTHGARRGSTHFVTFDPSEFIEKLRNIRAIIEAKQIRYLVLTSFELAVLHSRHRSQFMAWIRAIRNAGVSVIVFTLTCPGSFGALGALRYSARSVAEVGAYLKADTEFESLEMTAENEHVEANDDQCSPGSELEPAVTLEESTSNFHDLPDASTIYVQPRTLTVQHSDSDLLKTKDLALEIV